MTSAAVHHQRRECSDAMSLDAESVSSGGSTSNDTSGPFIHMKNPTNVSSPLAESTSAGETTSYSTSKSTRISTLLRSHRRSHRVPLSRSRTSQTSNGNQHHQWPPLTTPPTLPPHHLHITIKQLLQAWVCLRQRHSILLTTPLTDS